jgi:hypothetical protein
MTERKWDKEQVAIAARVVNGTPEGEMLIGYLLDYCHIYQTSFMPGDPHGTSYNEGQRSPGIELVSLLVNEPERFKIKNLRKVADQAQGN